MKRNVEEILTGLDALFEAGKMEQVEPFLQEALQIAMETQDTGTVITVVNELIGFYRDTSQYEKALYYCEQILPFMELHGLKGSIHYATTCLNVANACRAAGEWNASLRFYKEVEETYKRLLPEKDSLYASYYNNLSLLYQEMGQFEEACECLKKALKIIELYQDEIKIAITCSNLAASLLRTANREEAEGYLNRALSIFLADGERDFHYGAALSVMGELQFQKGNYEAAEKYYEKALAELLKHVGKTENYYRTLDNLEQVRKVRAKSQIGSLGRQMYADFYEEYGEPMLRKKFPAYLSKIAVGRVGEGSECFGFADELSMDHDFGPGFSLWVTRETYDAIGKYLQEEYEKLPLTFRGITGRNMREAAGRTGVCVIEDFYQRILGGRIPETLEDWLQADEAALAAATNGEVLRDEEGIFTSVREHLLSYYPREVWGRRLAQTMVQLSQYGQYNLERMWKRGDVVTATQCRFRFISHAMKMVYLLNRQYAPYYKWMYKGMESLNCFGVRELLERLTLASAIEVETSISLIEEICGLFLEELERQGLVSRREDTYLEHYAYQVMERLTGKEETVEEQELVEKLVQLEWKCFDKVENEGGRADCQDDWNTFHIMRKSQYLTWTKEMLLSYIQDFEEACERGWNLITEKYGRMMESTAKERYEEIKDSFPPISEEKKAIIEEIVKIQVGWMEEFAAQYPHMAGNSRVIHTYEDTPYSTSFETYLRGELGTYSDRTLELYGRFIVSYLQSGKNLTREIMSNTALLYGYESLERAEEMIYLK